MTDPANNAEEYWYIRVPKTRASKPEFHFFEQVGSHWEDGDGNHYYDIGEIIGIKYSAKGHQPGQWKYLIATLSAI